MRSRVHRRVHMDYVGREALRRATASSIGEFRIVGLFTSTAYTRSTRTIPYLRRKVDAVLRRAGFDPDSHSGKALVNVLESYPRDELFQIDEDTLYQFRAGDHAARRAAARARAGAARPLRPLRLGPGVRAARALRQRRAHRDRQLSRRRLQGPGRARSIRSSPKARWCACTSSSALPPGETPNPDRATLERAVEATRAHLDRRARRSARARLRSGARRSALLERYRDAFSVGYREAYSPADRGRRHPPHRGPVAEPSARRRFSPPPRRDRATRRAEGLEPRAADPALRARAGAGEHGLQGGRRAHLPDRAGTPRTRPRSGCTTCCWSAPTARAFDLDALKHGLEAAFLAVMRGGAENDGYNALVLAAGAAVARRRADPHHLALSAPDPRALFAGLHVDDAAQARRRSRPTSCACSMTRFDPRSAISMDERGARGRGRGRDRSGAAAGREPRRGPHPAPLRQCGAGGAAHQFLSDRRGAGSRSSSSRIKFASRKLDGLPLPQPLYEIFVYSPRVEGVHLRFGKVARGGIRWSDRPQDFRTEMLGLVKAQQVKNAVIVPVGAKGGFVPKLLPSGGTARGGAGRRHRRLQAVHLDACSTSPTISAPTASSRPTTSCATTTTIPIWWSPPTRAPRPSPTSPTRISQEHGFWLGDAFASGGSAGYDHKKMGITARGAWEVGEAPLPRDGRRHRHDAVHGRRRRRHVGRRVRQRHAARAHDQARRRVRSSRHLHRSRSRSGRGASPSASGCSSCRARAGRTTTRR